MSIFDGEWASNYDKVRADQTNPNNDPEIAASQERLRQYSQLTADQFKNPRASHWQSSGPGSNEGYDNDSQAPKVRYITYDTPLGPVRAIQQKGANEPEPPVPETPKGMGMVTQDKFWWKPGLAREMTFSLDEEGKVAAAAPKQDSRSLGQSIAQFAGSVVSLGAAGLAAYGLAAGAGALAGGSAAPATGAGAAGTGAAPAASGLVGAAPVATATPVSMGTVASAPGLGGVSASQAAAAGLTTTEVAGGATAASGLVGSGGSGAEAAASYSDAGAPGYNDSGSWGNAGGGGEGGGGGNGGASDWFGKLLGNDTITGGALRGVGGAVGQYFSSRDAQKVMDWRSAEAQKEREWKARNFGAGKAPVIDWKV